MAIVFYKIAEKHGLFSNFARTPVNVFGRTWKNSEAAFQAIKFEHDPASMQKIFETETPSAAAKLGRSRDLPLRFDWELEPKGIDHLNLKSDWKQPDDLLERIAEPLFARFKDVAMYEVVYAKTIQYPAMRELLLSTGDEPIIEDTSHANPPDSYWGWGETKLGENKLGRILMLIRESIQK